MPKKNSQPDFEKALSELESLVDNLEKGELPLEETLKQFERGIELTRSCQKALKSAEQRVKILLAGSETEKTEPFDEADE
ncbi:MAG: exodeoxyribonuclease VII small subunit [Gammaproteobacteria bacterium]|nr:exodeoxyribonuclease VII small subunit [Gammaproteobacteria bacterium]MCZ6716623.1 exodeoxyribonuclease VII small subunit [Gammaproteobacteria bacterium]MCZ6827142.1 exodeoxyribonuclease VII small subunit [Gammaproteobacteria bacterium]